MSQFSCVGDLSSIVRLTSHQLNKTIDVNCEGPRAKMTPTSTLHIYLRIYKNRWKLNNTCLLCAYLCAITCIRIASAFLLGENISCNQETRMGVVGVGRFAMGVRLIWYGCPPASMGVSTPTVEYNSPPMVTIRRNCLKSLNTYMGYTLHIYRSSPIQNPQSW